MRIFFGVVLPLLVQTLIVWVVIELNTGNGSFVGLGAMLIGMVAIPLTAIVNVLLIRSSRERPVADVLVRCYGFAAIAPALTILMMLF
ncbi:hypothetical protein E4T66_12125 [Sinimarinibacterium sp. CAU 1509]|uniref:hypothetical protein n=1 Tax=Sinimarinibacterium sp. CAU 1509 TaxID=2562283 RepID=UPI0010ACAEE1|nr:hypothetical protein [Sinimarinibacterium sp. CAU 1509]TJY59922.1 hypothetical protein E4T66_12125 [Sinimarinibacterium sp. CAU 1509]